MSSLPKKQPTLNAIMGIPIIGLPTLALNTLQFDSVNETFIWVAAPVAANILEVIETYEAIIDEASKTFTIDPAIDFDDDSEVILEIDIAVTGALNLLMTTNGVSSNFFQDGARIIGGVQNLINRDAQASLELMSSNLLIGANRTGYIKVSMCIVKPSNDRTLFMIKAAAGLPGYENTTGLHAAASTSLSEVEITTSANDWKIGTRMTLYRVKRS